MTSTDASPPAVYKDLRACYAADVDDAVWDRVIRSANHEEGDRVPIWDYLDNRAIWDHFNSPEDDFHLGMVRVYHELGIDLCRGYGAAFAESHEGHESVAGRVSRRVSGRTQWVTSYPIQALDEIRDFVIPELTEEQVAAWVADVRRRQESFAPHTLYVPGSGSGFHATYGLMGQELFAYAIKDVPWDLAQLMNQAHRNQLKLAQAAARERLCPIYFLADDVAYKQRLMFAPEFLRSTLIRFLERCCAPLNDAGIKVIFHSDGDITSLIDDLLNAGVAGINPIEPIAGMDIGALRRRYGHKLIMVGNVDCSQVLPLGTPDDVRAATRACLRAAAPGGGHFIGSSSEIVPATPVDNILAFYETCRTDGRYPIRC